MVPLLILLGSVTAISGAAVWVFFDQYKIYNKVKSIPTVPGLPLVGSAWEIAGSTENFFHFCNKWCKRNIAILGAWLGQRFYVILTEPADVQIVLHSQHCIEKSPDGLRFIQRWFGKGIGTAPDFMWKVHRKVISTTFSAKILYSFFPIFEAQSKKLIDELSAFVDKDPIDLFPLACSYSLRSVCETTLGMKSNSNSEETMSFIYACQTIVGIVMKRITNIWLYFDPIYKLTKVFRVELKTLNTINSFIRKIITEKVKNLDKTSMQKDEDGVTKPKIFLDQILQYGKFSGKIIEDHVNTMIFAGHETSGNTMSFAILLMAMYPEVQEKAAAEVNQMFIEKQTPTIELEDLKKLEYVERVINESLRLYPAAPLITRCAKADVDLTTTSIPTGTTILIPIYNIQRDKRIWGPDADKFNPDNFLPENMEKRHPLSFLPFSFGPRNCVGMKYAMYSMKVLMAHLLKNFEFSTTLKMDELHLKNELVLKLVNKHMISVKRRKNTTENLLGMY